ncbi:MAG TPA: hypothetical protein VGO93_04050 [Candidatus Xenobia bacterium]
MSDRLLVRDMLLRFHRNQTRKDWLIGLERRSLQPGWVASVAGAILSLLAGGCPIRQEMWRLRATLLANPCRYVPQLVPWDAPECESLADYGVEVEIWCLTNGIAPFWWGEDDNSWRAAHHLPFDPYWDTSRDMTIGEVPLIDYRYWDDQRGMLVEDDILKLVDARLGLLPLLKWRLGVYDAH